MHPRPHAYRCPLGCMLAKLQVGLGSSKHHPAESGCPTVKETMWNDTWMEQICGWFQMEQRRSLWLFAWIYHWYISWWIGHFQTNSYFNHVRIHAHWDFPGRRTCYQDLPSSGHRTNTISATYRNHKKNTCPMPNPPKVTARPVASRLPPQCFPMAGNTGFDWIPVGDSKVSDSYLIQQLIVVILVTVARSPRFPTRFISSHQSHEHVFWIAAAFAGL